MSLQEEVAREARPFLGIRLAQSAGLVADSLALAEADRRQQAELWKLRLEQQRQILGVPSTSGTASTSGQADQSNPAGEDVGTNVNVGDVTHNYYSAQSTATGATAPAAPAPVTDQTPPGNVVVGLVDQPPTVVAVPSAAATVGAAATASTGLSTLAKVAGVAAIAASGAGAGLGSAYLAGAFAKPVIQAAAAAIDPLQYELTLPNGTAPTNTTNGS